ncbi:hypothetical protein HPB00_06350 [Streptococcus suis]|nr:hypothetical protein [Streptococcus suis]
MTKKLGVLLVDVPEPRMTKYYFLEYSNGNYSIFMTNEKRALELMAMRCTQEEAKIYPEFRWVALEKLHDQ